MDIWERLQNIDRRILYGLLALAVSLPFLVAAPVPAAARSPQTRGFFDTLNALPPDKLVILSANFSASTAAENLSQTETVMRHLMRRRLPFAIMSIDPQGRELAQQTAERLQRQYGYQYGQNYVNWGFRPPSAFVNTVKAMVRDIPTAIGTDYRGNRVAGIPVMANVRGVDDVGAVIEVTASSSLPIWLQFFTRTGKQPTPTLYACTAVMAPEAFPLLKSGQLQGMLVGLKGAIEYEGMLGERGFATKASASLSYAHFLIVGLIVLGNIGMLATRTGRAGAAGRAPAGRAPAGRGPGGRGER